MTVRTRTGVTDVTPDLAVRGRTKTGDGRQAAVVACLRDGSPSPNARAPQPPDLASASRRNRRPATAIPSRIDLSLLPCDAEATGRRAAALAHATCRQPDRSPATASPPLELCESRLPDCAVREPPVRRLPQPQQEPSSNLVLVGQQLRGGELFSSPPQGLPRGAAGGDAVDQFQFGVNLFGAGLDVHVAPLCRCLHVTNYDRDPGIVKSCDVPRMGDL